MEALLSMRSRLGCSQGCKQQDGCGPTERMGWGCSSAQQFCTRSCVRLTLLQLETLAEHFGALLSLCNPIRPVIESHYTNCLRNFSRFYFPLTSPCCLRSVGVGSEAGTGTGSDALHPPVLHPPGLCVERHRTASSMRA